LGMQCLPCKSPLFPPLSKGGIGGKPWPIRSVGSALGAQTAGRKRMSASIRIATDHSVIASSSALMSHSFMSFFIWEDQKCHHLRHRHKIMRLPETVKKADVFARADTAVWSAAACRLGFCQTHVRHCLIECPIWAGSVGNRPRDTRCWGIGLSAYRSLLG
jgi:hypothetical protein